MLRRLISALDAPNKSSQKGQLNSLVQRLLFSLYSLRSVISAGKKVAINAEIAELKSKYMHEKREMCSAEDHSRKDSGVGRGAAVASDGSSILLAAPLVNARRIVRETLVKLQKSNSSNGNQALQLQQLFATLPSLFANTDKTTAKNCFTDAEHDFYRSLDACLSSSFTTDKIISELFSLCDGVRSFLREQGVSEVN